MDRRASDRSQDNTHKFQKHTHYGSTSNTHKTHLLISALQVDTIRTRYTEAIDGRIKSNDRYCTQTEITNNIKEPTKQRFRCEGSLLSPYRKAINQREYQKKRQKQKSQPSRHKTSNTTEKGSRKKARRKTMEIFF